MQRTRSQRIFQESCEVFPGGVNSPVRAFRELEMTPLVVESGEGEWIHDIEGNRWIDYCMSWGSLVLGHAYPSVVEAVQRQVQLGSSYGAITALELQLAQKISSCIPSLEKMRFVSSGTEATMSAIRLARAFSKKPVLIKFNGCYHGHADPLLVQAGSGVSLLPQASSLGIPEETIRSTLSLPYNDIDSFCQVMRSRSDVGCVIVEPIAANMGLIPAQRDFLSSLREETKKTGAVLIFDEVVTGFRVGLGGAQASFKITPDLTCLGKIIGGGLPAAAFGGKAAIMDLLAPSGGVYQAGTLSGNPLAMSAGLATLQKLSEPLFYETLQQKMDFLWKPIEQEIVEKRLNVCLHRYGSLFTLFFGTCSVHCKEDLVHVDSKAFQRFYQSMFSRGIYLSPSQFETNFLSFAHTQESLIATQKAMIDSL